MALYIAVATEVVHIMFCHLFASSGTIPVSHIVDMSSDLGQTLLNLVILMILSSGSGFCDFSEALIIKYILPGVLPAKFYLTSKASLNSLRPLPSAQNIKTTKFSIVLPRLLKISKVLNIEMMPSAIVIHKVNGSCANARRRYGPVRGVDGECRVGK